MNRIILRSQDQLLTEIRRRMRDATGQRWDDQEIYNALSDSIMQWYSRVAVPQVYTITGGWSVGQSEYDLPSYISGDITPQQRRYTDSYLYQFQVPSDQQQWVDVNNFQVWPNSSGGLTLHWGRAPESGDGRVLWWGRNGRLPVTVPTLNIALGSDDEAILLNTTEEIAPAGYIKIDNEYIAYQGVTETATGITALQVAARNVRGGTLVTANHDAGDSVYWCVAAHREDLFTQLYDAVRAELHTLYITAAAESERAHHERMAMYYAQRSMDYWKGYIPNKPTRLKLDRRISGDLGDETLHQVTI